MFLVVVDGVAVLVAFVVMGLPSVGESVVIVVAAAFFDDPADVGNLTSGSSAFSKTSLNIRKCTVHILLKPGLENFEHYFTSV